VLISERYIVFRAKTYRYFDYFSWKKDGAPEGEGIEWFNMLVAELKT